MWNTVKSKWMSTYLFFISCIACLLPLPFPVVCVIVLAPAIVVAAVGAASQPGSTQKSPCTLKSECLHCRWTTFHFRSTTTTTKYHNKNNRLHTDTCRSSFGIGMFFLHIDTRHMRHCRLPANRFTQWIPSSKWFNRRQSVAMHNWPDLGLAFCWQTRALHFRQKLNTQTEIF